MTMRLALPVLVLAVIVPASAGARDTAFPGLNGRIVFASKRDAGLRSDLFAAPVTGGRIQNLSRSPTWDELGPVVSPDGRMVAYRRWRMSVNEDFDEAPQHGNELWVRGVRSGAARRLGPTSTQPVWSPDSRSIAVGDDGRVKVIQVGTLAVREVAAGTSPSWSPDGSRLAFLAADGIAVANIEGGGGVTPLRVGEYAPLWSPRGEQILFGTSSGLSIVNADGTGLRPLAAHGSTSAASWSRDGRHIAFAAASPVADVSDGVFVVDSGGGSPRRVAAEAFNSLGGERAPAWSPDGTLVAFAQQSRIRAVRPDGTGGRWLTPAQRNTWITSGPAWSSDGGSVFFTKSAVKGDLDLFTARPDGSAVWTVTRNTVSELTPTWSPDGRSLAYTANGRVRVRSGSKTRALRSTPRPALSPSWSPDGSRITFRQLGRVFVVDSDGSRPHQIANGASSGPEWAPDGAAIAFSDGRAVRVVRPDGRGARRVHRPPSPEDSQCDVVVDALSWSPAGQLAFLSYYRCQEGIASDAQIGIVRTDGTVVRSLPTPDQFTIGSLAWSPDGRWLVLGGEGDPEYEVDPLADAWVRRSDGSGAWKNLTRGGGGVGPDWQPVCMIPGTARDDRLRGTSGADMLCGLRGNDTIRGWTGRDRLFGEDGNDRFLVRDGDFDIVGCGPGRDTVLADRQDLVGRDCERVVRR